MLFRQLPTARSGGGEEAGDLFGLRGRQSGLGASTWRVVGMFFKVVSEINTGREDT
jgi:hypothetical protein